MPSIGPLELGIILLIVLLVFGPKRLPGLGRQLGSGLREFKDSIGSKDRDEEEPDAFGRRQQLEAAESRPAERQAAEAAPAAQAAQDRPASRVEHR